MITFARFTTPSWSDQVLTADERAVAEDTLSWLSLSRGRLPLSADSVICHLTLTHDEAEGEDPLPTVADDGRWA
jgi:hypothetical protein